jgi:hypothetical protein
MACVRSAGIAFYFSTVSGRVVFLGCSHPAYIFSKPVDAVAETLYRDYP